MPPPLVVVLTWLRNTPLAILLSVSSGVSSRTAEPCVAAAYAIEQADILYDSVIIYHAMTDLIKEVGGYDFRLQSI